MSSRSHRTIRVFHNVCRHRGAVVVPEKCSGRRVLSCPYHRWVYVFGGERHDSDPGPGAPGLVPVRHAVWHDLIFVNISGDEVPFEEHWEPFDRFTREYDFSALRYAKTLEFEVKGNWKLIYENFYDAYHVPTVHPYMNEMTPLKERVGPKTEGPWFHNTSRIFNPQEGRGIGMPFYPGLDERGQTTEWYFVLFPAAAIQLWPDQFAVFQLHALAPGPEAILARPRRNPHSPYGLAPIPPPWSSPLSNSFMKPPTLYTNFKGRKCLTDVGTEGFAGIGGRSRYQCWYSFSTAAWCGGSFQPTPKSLTSLTSSAH